MLVRLNRIEDNADDQADYYQGEYASEDHPGPPPTCATATLNSVVLPLITDVVVVNPPVLPLG